MRHKYILDWEPETYILAVSALCGQNMHEFRFAMREVFINATGE